MKIKIKLMGFLKDKTPPGGELDVPDHGTIEDVLKVMAIPSGSVQVFTVNGRLERDPARELHAEDELVIIPPVGGG